MIMFIVGILLGGVSVLVGLLGKGSCNGDACADPKLNTEESCINSKGCSWSATKSYSTLLIIAGWVILGGTLLLGFVACMSHIDCNGKTEVQCKDMATRCQWADGKCSEINLST